VQLEEKGILRGFGYWGSKVAAIRVYSKKKKEIYIVEKGVHSGKHELLF